MMSWVEVPGVNSSFTPSAFRVRMSSAGNDAAAEHRDVVGALLAQQLEHAGEQIVVGAREHGEPDGVRVLLDRGGDDLLGGLMQARVDHLEARVPERPRDDLRAAIVAVEPRLGHHHADLALGHPAASYLTGRADALAQSS